MSGNILNGFSKPGMTLQELEYCIVNDIPYIKFVEFVMDFCLLVI